MTEMLHTGGGSFLSYAAMLLMAATPWVDVFVVIPLGIAWGLNPIATAVLAFIGNWIPLLLLALFFREFSAWRARRKARKRNQRTTVSGSPGPQPEGGSGGPVRAEPYGGEPPLEGSTASNETAAGVTAAGADSEEAALGTSKRYARARRIWEKYGVPGLALVAPVLLGTDLAALVALTFGSSRRWVMLWMTISLVLWTVLMTVGSVYGFGYMRLFRPGQPA
ncbi:MULTISPECIES: small multi-drug export protein [Paenibacillus]|uniref:small multi-drug export protein n=1 Tax=Paenibacillus TaxID=44249 RepID=UPI0022B85D47|nr:small multi-drug export protein [Paenibacillus caseinilyticus]MCZ8523273.1 small multi-drug export protein [Paenibacillus caseinilyticus]